MEQNSFTPTDVKVNNKKAGVMSLLLKKSEKGMGGERKPAVVGEICLVGDVTVGRR